GKLVLGDFGDGDLPLALLHRDATQEAVPAQVLVQVRQGPQANRLILRRRGQELAVGREGQGANVLVLARGPGGGVDRLSGGEVKVGLAFVVVRHGDDRHGENVRQQGVAVDYLLRLQANLAQLLVAAPHLDQVLPAHLVGGRLQAVVLEGGGGDLPAGDVAGEL